MFDLSDILWDTTQDLSFDRAYVRRRRFWALSVRDWKDIKPIPSLIQQHLSPARFETCRKIARKAALKWLQTRLGCTHMRSFESELHSLPEDAQLLWLGAGRLEDPRVRHWVAPHGDVQEVHIEGVATPIFQISGHDWILLPPWLRAKISSTLTVWDLANPESGIAVQTCWQASVRAGRWVKLERELGRVSCYPPRTVFHSIPSDSLSYFGSHQHYHHHHDHDHHDHHHDHHDHHHHDHHHPQQSRIPFRVAQTVELLRLFFHHSMESYAPHLHSYAAGLVASFWTGCLYEQPLVDLHQDRSDIRVVSILLPGYSFYDVLTLCVSELAQEREVWIEPLEPYAEMAAILAECAASLGLPLFLGTSSEGIKVTPSEFPLRAHLVVWNGGSLEGALLDCSFLDGTGVFSPSGMVVLDSEDLILARLEEELPSFLEYAPIGTPSDLDLALIEERRSLVQQVGQIREISGIEVAILPIQYIRPRAAHRMLTVYVASSLDEVYDVLEGYSPWLGWISLDTEGLFFEGQAEEGLRKLQTLFVDSCVCGMLHQLPLNKRRL